MRRRSTAILGALVALLLLVSAVDAATSGVINGKALQVAAYLFGASGTDGQVWTRDSTLPAKGKWAAAAAGNTTTTSALASPPSSPVSGDIWLPSDSLFLNRYSGSAWVPWGPIFKFTDPSLAGLSTWVNQGGASVDSTYGGIYLTAPAATGDNIRARVKTAPATPYVITAAFLMNYPAVNYPNAGLLFRESSSGKIVTFSRGSAATYYSLGVTKFTNSTTFSATYTAASWWSGGAVVWMRIADDGSNRICSYSADGRHWQPLHTVGRTDFLTADQVGIYANSNNATYPADATLLSWTES